MQPEQVLHTCLLFHEDLSFMRATWWLIMMQVSLSLLFGWTGFSSHCVLQQGVCYHLGSPLVAELEIFGFPEDVLHAIYPLLSLFTMFYITGFTW